jgi:hypothetical protein
LRQPIGTRSNQALEFLVADSAAIGLCNTLCDSLG